MQPEAIFLIGMLLTRLGGIAAGAFSIFLGYELFLYGVFPAQVSDSAVSLTFQETSLTFSNAAPGTFFVITGLLIVGLALLRPMRWAHNRRNETPTAQATVNEMKAVARADPFRNPGGFSNIGYLDDRKNEPL